MAEKLMIILGILCLGYFAGIAAYAGLSSKFPLLWAAAGICFLAAACFFHRGYQVWTGVKVAGLAGLVLFGAVELLIITAMFQKPDEDLDYVIVLGAQVKGNRPSLSLQYRIDRAAAYLKEHPQTRAVLSGGKGSGEDISEARCMRETLEAQGIQGSRLVEEDRSTNTKENIQYSFFLIQEEQSKKETNSPTSDLKVGIVTNNFHIFRGTAIAKKKTDCEIQGLSARSNWFLQANYLVREFFGVVKDKLAGNL